MSIFKRNPSIPDQRAASPAESSSSLLSLVKTAKVSLDKHGLDGQRAAVYLVLDRSGSMKPYYHDGSVQHLAEQALGLSANLDDDGIVPLVFFDHHPYPAIDISLSAFHGRISHAHTLFGGDTTMGGTKYTIAMQAVVDHYNFAGTAEPAFVIFQTDGQPSDADAATKMLRRYSTKPIFWAFVGFGGQPVPYLQSLDNLADRAVDNASYLHVGASPQRMPDSDLYDGITSQFAPWLTSARAAGIL